VRAARAHPRVAAAALLVACALWTALPGPLSPAAQWASLGVRVAAQLLALVVLAVRTHRRREGQAPWNVFGLAIVCWTLGDLLDATGRSDAALGCWIACYALVYAGLALLTRPLLLGGEAAVWMDGIAGALTCAAVVVDPVLRAVDRPSATGPGRARSPSRWPARRWPP
jgi:hypothetical protein